MIIISTHAPRMIPSEHLSRQRAGMNGIFDLSLVKNIFLGKRFEFFDHEIMKLALIAIGLLEARWKSRLIWATGRQLGML
jgi:hypothetical protein